MTTQYYIVDFDVYIKVFEENGKVRAVNQYGTDVPPARALEGQKTTQEAFTRAEAIASASR